VLRRNVGEDTIKANFQGRGYMSFGYPVGGPGQYSIWDSVGNFWMALPPTKSEDWLLKVLKIFN
jgi:hypothetical protein